MIKVNSVSNFNTQYQSKNNNSSTYKKEFLSDSVSFKSKLITAKPNTSLLKKLGAILGIGGTGTAVIVSNTTQNEETKDITEQKTAMNNNEEQEWNPECKGYQRLLSYGFSSDLIDKTMNILEPQEAHILKTGINTWIIRRGAEELHNLIKKEVNDDEKSAEITLRLLSQVFDKAIKSNVGKSEYLMIRPLEAAIRIYGLDAFNRGTLVNYGYWNSDFRFEDENGKDITDREQERIDSDGNKIVEEINSYGDIIKDGKGKKYSPDNRLLEEWSSGSRTIYEYDDNNKLVGKQEEYGNGFHRHLDKYNYISGSWVKVK